MRHSSKTRNLFSPRHVTLSKACHRVKGRVDFPNNNLLRNPEDHGTCNKEKIDMRKKTEAENEKWRRETPEIIAALTNNLPAWMQPAYLPGRSHACLPGWVPTCPPSCLFSCVASAFLPALWPAIITISCVFADIINDLRYTNGSKSIC